MNQNKLFLVIEFILLCIALPTAIIYFRLAPYMFAFLWTTAGYCWFMYKRRYFERFRTLFRWRAITWKNLKTIIKRWIICCIFMTVFIYFYDPDKFLYLPKEKPFVIPFLLILYPLLSALPQEFIFCNFLFHRYRHLVPNVHHRIIMSAIVFAYAHILFINWVAPLLSLVAGFIFAETYAKTRSLALVTIEHSLYGSFLFIIGLGWYFYGGAVAQTP